MSKELVLPEGLEGYGGVVMLGENEEAIEIDLYEVLDCLEEAQERPLEVMAYLLKVRQGISSIAFVLEEAFARQSDAFRVWRAEEGRFLNRKDELNPLVKEGSKTTDSAIEAYLRAKPEYTQFKEALNEIEVGKNTLWNAKKTLDYAIEQVIKTTGQGEVEE